MLELMIKVVSHLIFKLPLFADMFQLIVYFRDMLVLTHFFEPFRQVFAFLFVNFPLVKLQDGLDLAVNHDVYVCHLVTSEIGEGHALFLQPAQHIIKEFRQVLIFDLLLLCVEDNRIHNHAYELARCPPQFLVEPCQRCFNLLRLLFCVE